MQAYWKRHRRNLKAAERVARDIARKMIASGRPPDVWSVLDSKMEQAYRTIDTQVGINKYLSSGR